MRIHALPLAAAGLLLALTLSACSGSPALRTAPDQVEKAAVLAAQSAAVADGITISDDLWVQLWTPTQAALRITHCVDHGSDGLIVFNTGPLASNAGSLSYSLSMVPKDASKNGGIGPPFFDDRTAQNLVDGCIAEFPIDFRLVSVPARDRGALYAYDLTVLRRCLLAHGQPVPPMPSRERFERLLPETLPWNAYEQVRVSTRAEWYALVDACPALPPAIAGDVAALTTSATTP